MKPAIYALPAALCLLIGIAIGYRNSGELEASPPPQVTQRQAPPERSADIPSPTSSPVQDFSAKVKVSPTSIEHLQALELIRHEVPGKALVKNLPRLFESSYEVSGALSAIMELSGEEEDQLNEFMSSSLDELGKMESDHVTQQTNSDGSTTMKIPARPQDGAAIRESLLGKIEANLGPKRRALMEMHLLNNSGLLGNFGSEALTLSLPNFEETHKRENLITLNVGRTILSDSGNPQEVFEERAFFLRNFKKRFGHLYDLKPENDQE